MCGIFGIIGKQDPELLKRMDEVLFHRGPDSSGAVHFGNASIGVRRLSIIDLEKGDQPIHNENNQLWVVQNGEIYNYCSLRKELITKGHKFYTNSDTEVIVHAYEEFGEDCVKHFNGMFSFVIWDEKKKKLFGARDRVGIKPFYYWQNGELLLFASEIKALLQDSSFNRQMDITSFYNYLSRLFVPGNKTIFKGIKRLPPGHKFVFHKGALHISAYWDLDMRNKIARKDNEYREGILEKLENAVKKRLVSDVPLGAFLSGGVDSNGVVAFMVKNSSNPVKTFTMGYTGHEHHLTNEISYARDSAEYYETDHREFIIDPLLIIKHIPRIVWFFDEPYAGGLPQYPLSNLAQKHVKVILCGLGGDELFGDYGRGVRLASSFSQLSQIFLYAPSYVKKMLLGIDNFIPDVAKNSRVYRYFYNYIIKMLEIGKYYVNQQAIFSEDLIKRLLKNEVFEQIDIKDILKEMFYAFLARTKIKIVEDIVMYSNFKTQLVNEYLRYTDVLSMAHSLEARVPFLDHELVEYAASIPFCHLVRGNDAKYLLKEALKDVLPPGTGKRKKGYFSLPYGDWLRTELRGFVLNYLSRSRIEHLGYFYYDKINEIVSAQYAGDDSKNYQVWNLLMFVLWHEIFMEKGISHISQVENSDLVKLCSVQN